MGRPNFYDLQFGIKLLRNIFHVGKLENPVPSFDFGCLFLKKRTSRKWIPKDHRYNELYIRKGISETTGGIDEVTCSQSCFFSTRSPSGIDNIWKRQGGTILVWRYPFTSGFNLNFYSSSDLSQKNGIPSQKWEIPPGEVFATERETSPQRIAYPPRRYAYLISSSFPGRPPSRLIKPSAFDTFPVVWGPPAF